MTNETEIQYMDFPFDEIRRESGDYFDTIQQAREAGYSDNQIWSVTEDNNTFCYGPSRHWVNLLGYVATAEKHNDNTYYLENLGEWE